MEMSTRILDSQGEGGDFCPTRHKKVEPVLFEKEKKKRKTLHPVSQGNQGRRGGGGGGRNSEASQFRRPPQFHSPDLM